MPYNIRKRKCRKSSGERGSWVLSYTDKKGKKHSNCHSSKKGAKGQIAAIEGPRESKMWMGTRTQFINPYEDPGVEFEIDPEDPVGLIRAAVREEILSLIGDNWHSKEQ